MTERVTVLSDTPEALLFTLFKYINYCHHVYSTPGHRIPDIIDKLSGKHEPNTLKH